MKKTFWAALLLFSTVLLQADQFASLHKYGLLKNLYEEDALIDGTKVFYTVDRFTITEVTKFDDETKQTYYPFGFADYKVYIPAGVKKATLNIMCYPNSDNLVHMTFVGRNETAQPVYDHAGATALRDSTWNMQGTVKSFFVNTHSMAFDTDAINAAGGGWIYLSFVEDDSNPTHDSYFGEIHPEIRLYFLITVDKGAAIDQWVSETPFLSKSGDPSGPAAKSMKIINRPVPNSAIEKVISTDYGTQRYANLQEYIDLYGDLVISSSSSSKSVVSSSSAAANSSSVASQIIDAADEADCTAKGGTWDPDWGTCEVIAAASSSVAVVSSSAAASSVVSSVAASSAASSNPPGDDEADCIANGGNWDSDWAACEFPSSVSSVRSSSSSSIRSSSSRSFSSQAPNTDEADCVESGGTWDSDWGVCNNGEASSSVATSSSVASSSSSAFSSESASSSDTAAPGDSATVFEFTGEEDENADTILSKLSGQTFDIHGYAIKTASGSVVYVSTKHKAYIYKGVSAEGVVVWSEDISSKFSSIYLLSDRIEFGSLLNDQGLIGPEVEVAGESFDIEGYFIHYAPSSSEAWIVLASDKSRLYNVKVENGEPVLTKIDDASSSFLQETIVDLSKNRIEFP